MFLLFLVISIRFWGVKKEECLQFDEHWWFLPCIFYWCSCLKWYPLGHYIRNTYFTYLAESTKILHIHYRVNDTRKQNILFFFNSFLVLLAYVQCECLIYRAVRHFIWIVLYTFTIFCSYFGKRIPSFSHLHRYFVKI